MLTTITLRIFTFVIETFNIMTINIIMTLSRMTFSIKPVSIREKKGVTLYMLSCTNLAITLSVVMLNVMAPTHGQPVVNGKQIPL
jgi:hypothetical protein